MAGHKENKKVLFLAQVRKSETVVQSLKRWREVNSFCPRTVSHSGELEHGCCWRWAALQHPPGRTVHTHSTETPEVRRLIRKVG